MSDENNQNADNSGQQDGQTNNRPDNRFKDLSDKYAKEAEARKQEAEARVKAEKEVEFYKGFTPLASKYQNAAEYQDKIKEKYLAGNGAFDLEESTVAVLGKEGKLPSTPVMEQARPKESPVGGSAPTTLRSQEKTYAEMDKSEKRDELIRLEQETGAISGLFNRTL